MSAKRVKETTQAVQRSIDILEAVASVDGSVGVSALARMTALSKATTYRLCQTLVDRHFLDQDAQTGEYRLGGRLLKMASRLLGRIDLTQMSRSVLEQMAATGRQNAFVGLLQGTDSLQEMLVCEEIRFDNPVQPRSLLGLRLGLLDAPGGLMCLGGLDEKRLESVLKSALHQSGKTDPSLPQEFVGQVRNLRGSAYSVQEGIPYPNTVAICSLVTDRRDQVMGVVGYCCPQLSHEHIDREQLGAICSQAARSLSAILSGHSESAGGPGRK